MLERNGFLKHVRVLDLTLFLSGPFSTQILADLGAEVIKVEPADGDMTRHLPPNFISGMSAYFHSINRSKKSVVINYKTSEGLELIKRLIEQCDVLIENQRPGGLAASGVSYAMAAEINPRMIYCSISGFGQDGPDHDRPAYDMVVQALSGGMSLTGETDGRPVRAGIPIADLAAGMYAATAILAALEARNRTGRGSYLDIAMLDCQIALLSYQAAYFLASGDVPGPQGRGHESIPTYRSFTAVDGRDVVVCANTDRMFVSLCEAVGLPDLGKDPELATRQGRYHQRERIVRELERAFLSKKADEWVEILLRCGVPVGTVNDLADAFANPQVQWRQMEVSLQDENGAIVRVAGNPIKTPLEPDVELRFPPRLAQHTMEVLSDLLGLSSDQIRVLAAEKVVSLEARS